MGSIKVEVTLKQGNTITFHVDSITLQKTAVKPLAGLKWVTAAGTLPEMFYLDLEDVSAIITTEIRDEEEAKPELPS